MYISEFQDVDSKRVKERLVESAYNKVLVWRKIFQEGLINEQGEKQYFSLKEAAKFVGVPKKTLEDYTSIFHKVGLVASLFDFQGKKMGFLRNYIRKNKSKIRKASIAERLKQAERKRENLNLMKNQTKGSSFLEDFSSSKETEQFIEKVSDQNLFNSELEEIDDVFQESHILLPIFKS
ncbi:unnamed protein product (macronuclear) [Paramecium tetraurelia]|uniref:HTH merR-type domain-containing protein n=1 Tax=Paramecium tetraurelia TaxID=5888 RepID=A0EAQ8_PARTE|nr:uncharacterized protein GSPATT00025109001 [Paramecium tetraurelia]CAK92375.1 unnamed protein product [Paramecium tetraurelia]|eukprot:XP_001459772.1 hypothetical protein (macronuclear) [Paramecium tetraurelia strain d4-2]